MTSDVATSTKTRMGNQMIPGSFLALRYMP